MPDSTLTEAERRALERLDWWGEAVRSCAIVLVLVVGVGGVIALGPLLLQVSR